MDQKDSDEKISSTFCPLPWMSQSIRNNGEMRICCHSNHGPGRGILRDENDKPLNVQDADLERARNAPLLKEVRAHMLKGQWHPSCARCEREEKAGVRSRRTYESQIWTSQLDPDKVKQFTKSDGRIETSEFPVLHMDIRFGNKCNLRCRSCGPTDSSAWYRDYVKVWGSQFNESSGPIQLVENGGRLQPSPNPYDWHEANHFWEQMSSRVDSLFHLYLVGGEPLLIERHYEFLEECVKRGAAKQIVLEYNSNITTLPDRVWDLWSQFKKVKVGASLDGVGPLNDYIRYPSKWDKLEENLKKLAHGPDNIQAWFAATIMIYNIYSLPEMMKWVIGQSWSRFNDLKWQPILTPHPLHSPPFLSAQALPKSVKERVSEKFKEELVEIERAISESGHRNERKQAMQKNAPRLLKQYERFMWQDDKSHELDRFWFYTKKLDEVRGQKFFQACPDLYELLHHTQP